MTEREAFDAAIAAVFAHEGIDADDPADRGGRTRFGISQAAYPGVDIASLTLEDAKAIYYRGYWERPRINELPWPISGKALDVAVHCGAGMAIKMLQVALCRASHWVNCDGKVGPQTIAACKAVPADRLLAEYCGVQRRHYERIIERDPTQEKFRRGWMRRAEWKPQ